MHVVCYTLAVLCGVGALAMFLQFEFLAGVSALISAVIIATLGYMADQLRQLVEQGRRAERLAREAAEEIVLQDQAPAAGE